MDSSKYTLNYINKFNECYSILKRSFTEDDIRHLQGKDVFKEKLVGLFTKDYYQRKNLILHGAIMYAYVFKIVDQDFLYSQIVDTWVLFSSDYSFRANPELYKDIALKLDDFLNDKLLYKNKKLKSALASIENMYKYFKLPSEIVGEAIVYYCNALQYARLNKDIRLGINLVFANKSVSKEIFYVSDDIIKEVEDMMNNSEVLQ